MSVISLEEWRKKQELLLQQKSPSMQSIKWDELGLIPTDLDPSIATAIGMYIVLDKAWRSPFKVSSRFARDGAVLIAIAASEGMISTCIGEDQWGEQWLITEFGMEMKGELDDLLKEIFSVTPDITH